VLNLRLVHQYPPKRNSDSVSTACNGIEAVAFVREAAHKGTHFDIIFMDFSMPEMDGFGATRLIRSFERSFSYCSVSEDLGLVDTTLEDGNLTEDEWRRKIKEVS